MSIETLTLRTAAEHASYLSVKAEIERRINLQYSVRSRTIDYAGMTKILVSVLRTPEFTPGERVDLCKRTIEAFTRNEYFVQ